MADEERMKIMRRNLYVVVRHRDVWNASISQKKKKKKERKWRENIAHMSKFEVKVLTADRTDMCFLDSETFFPFPVLTDVREFLARFASVATSRSSQIRIDRDNKIGAMR